MIFIYNKRLYSKNKALIVSQKGKVNLLNIAELGCGAIEKQVKSSSPYYDIM